MRSPRWLALVAVALPVLVIPACTASGQGRRKFSEVSELPLRHELPDPLVFLDGRRVQTPEEWENERKPELKALFQHYMYGYFPPPPDKVRFSVERVDRGFLGGKATRKEVRITLGRPGCPALDLLVAIPGKREGPAPVFLGLNFTGNHSVVADPGVPLPRSWMRASPVVDDHRATEKGRGTEIEAWAIEQSIDRGYAVATLYYGDILPDKPDFKDGVYPYFLPAGRSEPAPEDWGALACWAWGLHRAVDYLVTDPDIDPARIAVTGHSRNGKAALIAAAFDERIALAIPHQAGCGGTAPSRTRNSRGETVKAINKGFPHWFNDVFPRFNEEVDRLPFDQHCLVALVAPRPVLFTNGIEDQWADPPGQFEVLRAADPVYRFLGWEGLEAEQMPPLGKLADSRLGYYVREGGHVADAAYWRVFLHFADKHLKATAP